MNSLYNPNQKNKDELISEFVVRQDIYEEIMRDLESSKMKHPEQHYLLVGQRGMGKTTLLVRLKYGIEDSTILAGRLLPIAFTEEQYQISELANLWEYVAEYLEDHHGFNQLYDSIGKQIHNEHFEEKAYEILNSALNTVDKNIVLLIDNIGDLFHKLETIEIRRLREILQTNSRIRVIGGSTSYLQDVLDYQQPFYEFFKIIRLDGLSKVEAVKLILRLGEIYGEKEKIERIVRDTPGRLETLRILAGGVPRTISIMFGIFLDYEHGSALKDLYKILDLVTPLYKHRMDDLPVQQQKIIDAVARNWEPITVKELAARTRVVSKTLSAQLNQLEKEQIVVKHDTATKNKTYMVRERFWNIWYLMRYGRRDDKEKIIWLVKFLEAWFSEDELKVRIEAFVEKVKKEGISDDQLQLFSKVYASLKNLPANSKLKLKSIEDKTNEEIVMNDGEWIVCAREAYYEKNYFDSLCHLVRATNLFNEEQMELVRKLGEPGILINLFEEISQRPIDEFSDRAYWAFSIMFILDRASRFKDGDDCDADLEFLRIFLSLGIIFDIRQDISAMESSFSILIVADLLRRLLSLGFYNAVYKMVDEVCYDNGNKIVWLKDIWKPFYLAVKHFNNREELEKLPAELREPALQLQEAFSGKESIIKLK